MGILCLHEFSCAIDNCLHLTYTSHKFCRTQTCQMKSLSSLIWNLASFFSFLVASPQNHWSCCLGHRRRMSHPWFARHIPNPRRQGTFPGPCSHPHHQPPVPQASPPWVWLAAGWMRCLWGGQGRQAAPWPLRWDGRSRLQLWSPPVLVQECLAGGSWSGLKHWDISKSVIVAWPMPSTLSRSWGNHHHLHCFPQNHLGCNCNYHCNPHCIDINAIRIAITVITSLKTVSSPSGSAESALSRSARWGLTAARTSECAFTTLRSLDMRLKNLRSTRDNDS